MKTNHLLLVTLLYAFPSYGMMDNDIKPLTADAYSKIIEAASKRVIARNEKVKSSPSGSLSMSPVSSLDTFYSQSNSPVSCVSTIASQSHTPVSSTTSHFKSLAIDPSAPTLNAVESSRAIISVLTWDILNFGRSDLTYL